MNRAKPTIVVTQGEGAGGSLAASLRARGAEVFALPTVSIEPPEDDRPLDAALAEIDGFDWIVFTSRHAVEAVCRRPAWQIAKDMSQPGLRVAAAGKATAELLAQLGVTADLVPETAGGASLAALMISGLSGSEPSFTPRGVPSRGSAGTGNSVEALDITEAHRVGNGQPLRGLRILWPRSDVAHRELPDVLRGAGAEIVEPVAYRTALSSGSNLEEFLRRLDAAELDAVAFMSPSSARNLTALLGSPDLALLARRLSIASIGPTTSEALRELLAPPDVESAARTAEDLAATLLSYLESRRISRRTGN